MKVVHINKTDAGGGASVAVRRIHNALRKSGIESSMLVAESQTTGDPDIVAAGKGSQGKAVDFLNFVKERLRILPHERYRSMRYNFSIASDGRDISEHPLVRDADIIHLHWINQGFLSMDGLEKLAALGKPFVWTLHDMWPFTGGCHYAGTCLEFNEHCGFCPYLRKPGKNDLSAQAFRQKRTLYGQMNISVVSCSQWLDTLARSSALFHKKFCVNIPNPIDTSVFTPLDKMACRRELGLPTDKKLLLFGAAKVGDIRKGYRYLIEALRIISDSFPAIAHQLELVVFGKMGKELDELGTSFNVHPMNFISDTGMLVKLYNAADTFVLPSLQDNLPNTVVESQACGTPVVGFRIGGVPEMVEHGKTGFLAEAKNSLSLANGIYSMMFFDHARQRGYVAEHARAIFGEEVIAKQYIDVYEKALRGDGK